MMLIKLAWRNIWRNKKRSLITITAIVVAVFLSITMRSLQLGMYDNMIGNVVGSFSGYIQVHSSGYWDEQIIDNAFEANSELLKKVEATNGVSNVIKRVQSGSLSSSGDLSKFVFVFLRISALRFSYGGSETLERWRVAKKKSEKENRKKKSCHIVGMFDC